MTHLPIPATSRLLLGLLVGGCTFGAVSALASPLELVYSGVFNTTEALNLASAVNPTYFPNPTAYTIHALFDDSSPNLAPIGPPFIDFRAYAPSSVIIDI